MMHSLSHQHLLHHIAALKQKGKPFKRVKQSLPFSPRKRRCVVESIAMEVGLNVASSPSPLITVDLVKMQNS